ncbi:DUF4129 domain-containing protein [Arsenicicoccus sp. oral taxon 190]|uniref:DUF4129 domain-containing protein n=1 Tax=Arsenicicoccus sp. oral taxon 190 TaxID=1658671 RepID=UPI00067D7C47|nr:DUF4129 domain-containing protein [Arsenicicoccus sp. oral taxon 190]
MTVRRRSLVAGAALALLAVLLVWGAVAGPGFVGSRPTRAGDRDIVPPMPDPLESMRGAAHRSAPPQPQPDLFWLTTVLTWVGTLAAVLVALLVGWAVLRWWRQREPAPGPAPELGVEVGAAPVLDEQQAVDHRALLGQGSPRNGIVACWVELERLVAASGVARRPAETPAELARRVLTQLAVPAPAVDALAEAYREARFSRHPLTEVDRDRAAAALDQVHAALLSPRRAAGSSRSAETV